MALVQAVAISGDLDRVGVRPAAAAGRRLPGSWSGGAECPFVELLHPDGATSRVMAASLGKAKCSEWRR